MLVTETFSRTNSWFFLARLTPGQTRSQMAFEGKVDDPSQRVAGGEWTRTARHMNLLRTAPQLHCVIITFLLSSFVRFFSRARFLLLPFNKEKKRIKNVETKVVGKRDVESNARKAQLLGKFVVASSLMNLLLLWCLQSGHVLGRGKISNWIEREMNHFCEKCDFLGNDDDTAETWALLGDGFSFHKNLDPSDTFWMTNPASQNLFCLLYQCPRLALGFAARKAIPRKQHQVLREDRSTNDDRGKRKSKRNVKKFHFENNKILCSMLLACYATCNRLSFALLTLYTARF